MSTRRDPGEQGEDARREHVRRAVRRGLSRWSARHGSVADQIGPSGRAATRGADQPPGVVAPLPRRTIAPRHSEAHGALSPARKMVFHAGVLRAMTRLLLWLWALLRYACGTLLDLLTFRDTIQRRAARLRRIFESLGVTFIKVGQQLSVRADFLRYEYCEELAKMLDRVPPFPTEQAIATIERDLGRRLGEIFAVFDPTPIGSASLACVYQAQLHNGERVAVKVRRPGITTRLAGDLRALGWLLRAAEALSLARSGISDNLLAELRVMFTDELNFYQEARYTELFRRFAEEQEQSYLSAPKVYFDLLSENVLCTEFISGVFLWEIINALDHQDEAALAELRAQGFDPAAIASALVMAFNYEMIEGLFFHADPHPANIVVRPGNSLVFIDFGSCGQISRKSRRLWLETQRCIAERDVQGLVKCTVAYMEPLPHIDLDRFIKEVETLYWGWMYAINSQNAEWWEKASGPLWMKLASITQRYNIPMSLDSLRIFRATFLYDTVMLRLWKRLDYTGEYKRYYQQAGDRARRRVRGAIRKRLKKGLSNSDYMQIEELVRMGNQFMVRLQHVLDTPQFSFSSMMGKMAFGVSTVLKLFIAAGGVYLAGLLGLSGYQLVTGRELDLLAALELLSASRWLPPLVLLVALILVRKVLMRLQDVDTRG